MLPSKKRAGEKCILGALESLDGEKRRMVVKYFSQK